MNRRLLVLIFSIFLFASFSVGCASSPDTKDGALTGDEARVPVYFDKIPANSPYVFTTLKPFPREVMEPYLAQYGALSAQASRELNNMGMGGGSEYSGERLVAALLEEFSGVDSVEGLESLGISATPQMAVYGIGWFPVMRVTLSDSEAFTALLDRLDAKSGLAPQMRASGKVTYRQYDDGGEVKIAVAVTDGQLIVGLAPSEAFDDFVGYMLGQKELGRTLADVNSIQDIQAQYKMTPFGVGYVDIEGIVGTVTGATAADPVTAEMIEASGFNFPELSEVCRAETMEMVAKAPRLVFGYTTVSTEMLGMKAALEVKGPYAAELAAIGSPIPGFSGASLSEMLFSFGLGVDIKKAVDFANVQANRINEDPYQCEDFAYLNEMAQGTTGMSGMMPQFLSTLRGAFVGVHDVDFNAGAESVKGLAMLGSSNPVGVFSQMRTFVPQLQNIQLKADGVALSVPELAQASGLIDLFLVMTQDALGASTGPGMKEELANRIESEPAAGTQDPLVIFAYDYSKLMQEVSRQSMSMGQSPGSVEMFNTMANMFGLFVMEFYATDHALVMDYHLSINPSAAGGANP
ncbi:hypothetical protein [Bradymonas sediminis]|uniref:Uncharacterized protein n=1 Tax=Bradymonas sediminis TaxID=1548548 RepID=A0A2Z4FL07_9DELT|nr:hypothetical protein [Bradymonas sediminis]AWV89649.1 hypothetical protein DN745_09990 [Bradymonas sediminis]TDP76611.1 hypothetical protein DFR33_102243 [Bradymonas sediminis]